MTDKGRAGKRTRYIKQNLDAKGRILKSSKVVSYWATFNFVRLAYLVGIAIGFVILALTIK